MHADGREFLRTQVLTIARLYSIALGRMPDPGGLSHVLSKGYDDELVEELTKSLLASEEFRIRVAGTDARAFLVQNAGVEPADHDEALPLLDLVRDLAARQDIIRPLSIADALVGSVRADDRALYNLWLECRHQERPRPGPVPGRPPLLSVIVERHDAVAAHGLASSVASIAAQTDPSVELIVAVRGRPEDATLAALSGGCGLPARLVKVIRRRSATTLLNKALRAAKGAFTCRLGDGDRLDPDLVAHLSRAAAAADVVLGDQDVIDDASGGFRSPSFNAGWDPEAALARPPRSLVMARTEVLRRMGGFRALAEGDHDWDVLLRASRTVPAARIGHICAILVHRRPPAADAGLDTPGAGRPIVRSHLDDTGRSACRIDGTGRSEPIRVVYPVPSPAPLASIIIPTRDQVDYLRPCLEGVLHRTAYPSLEVIVVDNGSGDDRSRRFLREAASDPRVRVLSDDEPFNWSAMNNRAVAAMRGEVAVLLNNDTDVIEPDWLREMVSLALRPSVGIVGAKLLYPDRRVQHAGVGLEPELGSVHLWRYADGVAPGYLDQLRIVRSVAAVTGACLAIRRSVFEEVGGLEQDELRITWSDTDLCLRVRAAGYRVVWTPHALLYHVELATRGHDLTDEQRARFDRESRIFKQRWGRMAETDPYFSPDLVMLASEPRLRLRRLEDRAAEA